MNNEMVLDKLSDFCKHGLDFFFGENFPDTILIFWLFPLMLFIVFMVLKIDLFFQKEYDWKVAYTRKFFHFSIFGLAGLLQYLWGISAVFILGWSVSVWMIYLLLKESSTAFYSLLARPNDMPHPSRYIVYPYIATFLGGVVNNIFFPSLGAIAGYLVAGFGDAVGEPVGSKFGRHKYPVFNWGSSVKSYRSIEGSMAVMTVSMIAFICTLYAFGYPLDLFKITIAALLAAIVEGISPHGWDNFTSQITGAILMSYFLI